MIVCDECRGRMVEALYRELDDGAVREFDAHIAGCADCASLFEEMRATLDVMDRRRRPEPGGDFWDTYWERLQERMARDDAVVDSSRSRRRRLTGSWGFRVGAAVVVLAAGVWIGRSVSPPRPAPRVIDTPKQEVATESHAPERSTGGAAVVASADMRARRYIDRSQVVLLELVNAGGGRDEVANLGAQRRRAQELVAQAGPLRSELTAPRDRRLRELVGQLELILREIAHLEEEDDLDAVDVIRSRVNREGVLFRIDLEQMREPAAAADSTKARPQGAIDPEPTLEERR